MTKYAFPAPVSVPYNSWRSLVEMVRNLYLNIKDADPDSIAHVSEFFKDGPNNIACLYEHVLDIQEKAEA